MTLDFVQIYKCLLIFVQIWDVLPTCDIHWFYSNTNKFSTLYSWKSSSGAHQWIFILLVIVPTLMTNTYSKRISARCKNLLQCSLIIHVYFCFHSYTSTCITLHTQNGSQCAPKYTESVRAEGHKNHDPKLVYNSKHQILTPMSYWRGHKNLDSWLKTLFTLTTTVIIIPVKI